MSSGLVCQVDRLAAGAGDSALAVAARELIDRDRLPGQPACSAAMLDLALAGRSPVDDAFWQDIVELHNVVVEDGGQVVGAAAFGRKRDGGGTIPWLHAAERPAVVEALLGAAEERLGVAAGIDAFQHATALTVAVEGLPIRCRSVTHRALLARGYQGEDLWLAMIGVAEPSTPITGELRPAGDGRTDLRLLDGACGRDYQPRRSRPRRDLVARGRARLPAAWPRP